MSANFLAFLTICLVFTYWNVRWLIDYSAETGMRVTPWVLPHQFSMPVMMVVYAGLTAIAFSKMPHKSALASFVVSRGGRRSWIIGQMLFLIELSLTVTACFVFLPALLLLPRMEWSASWGTVLETLARSPGAPMQYGILPQGMMISDAVVRGFSPVQATLLSAVMLLLVTLFLAFLMFFATICWHEGAGITVAGGFGFTAYFCSFLGYVFWGPKLYFISPVSWLFLPTLTQASGPNLGYALLFLLFGTMGTALLGAAVSLRKDTL